MISLALQKREPLPFSRRILLPILAAVLALATTSIYIVIASGDVLQVYYVLFSWPIQNATEVLVTAAPLLLLALSVMVAFRARFWNIGVHGQFIAGGLMAAVLGVQLGAFPSPLLMPLVLAGSWLVGSGVALISWFLKVKRNQDEVLTTILIWCAVLLVNAGLLTGPLRSPFTTYPQSQEISANAMYPILIPGTRLHLGTILSFAVLVLVWFMFSKTTFKTKVVAVTSPRVAMLEGVNVSRVYFWVAFFSGGIAGFAGANEVMGILRYMTPFVGPNYGLVALATAMLGGLNAIGVTIATLFFSVLINGANAMSWTTGVPSFLSDIIQAQTLIFLLVLNTFNNYRIVIRKGTPRQALGATKIETGLRAMPDGAGLPSRRPGIRPLKSPILIVVFLVALGLVGFLFPEFKGSSYEVFLASVLGTSIVISTPIILAALGETFSEKAGVINLGILGVMISGAAWGFISAYFTGSFLNGVLVAAVTGAAYGLLLSFLIVTLGAQQHIAGIALTFYSMNVAYFFHRVLIGAPLVEPTVPQAPQIQIPFLDTLPIVGILFRQVPYVYMALFILPALAFFFFRRTKWGLILRAVGENPRAADGSRIRVHLVRYLAVTFGATLMSVGGAFYSLVDLRSFNLNVGGEWSWIALALVVLGNWNPLWVVVASVLFGALNAVQLWLVITVVQIPFQLFQIVPYVLTIGLSTLLGKLVRPPKALLAPYRRE